MRFIPLSLFVLLGFGCAVSTTPDPLVINISVVDFGSTESTIASLPDYFLKATMGLVDISIDSRSGVEFPAEDSNHPYQEALTLHPGLHPKDVILIWYRLAGVNQILSDLNPWIGGATGDVVVILTEAQFEGLGLFLRVDQKYVILLKTRAIGGWAGGTPYYRETLSEKMLADTAIHELGHYMGLAHACQCSGNAGCCAGCASRNDVMSYCRVRPVFEKDSVNVFSACNLANIRTNFIEALGSGVPIKLSDPCR